MLVNSTVNPRVDRVTINILLIPMKITLNNMLLNNNIEYSPRKRKAKDFPLYSVLYPLTNSLSLSLKSNGVRCNSANILISMIGKIIQANQSLCSKKLLKLKVEYVIDNNRIQNMKVASYLIVLAALRSIPIKEYLLFLLHPLIMLKKTITLLRTRYHNIPILHLVIE